MNNEPHHFIQRLSIEIEFGNVENGIGMQNHIAAVFYEKIQPCMEVLFDELFGKNYFASIDKLEIDCGLLNKKNWEQEFTEVAIRKLKEGLLQVNKTEIDVNKVEEVTAVETFFFFLENGFLPWNKRVNTIADLEQLININEKLILQLKKSIDQNGKVAERFVRQFSKKFVSVIIDQIAEGKKDELREIYLLLDKIKHVQMGSNINNPVIDTLILQFFASDEKPKTADLFFTSLLAKAGVNRELKFEIEESFQNRGVKEKSEILTTKEKREEQSEAERRSLNPEKIRQKIRRGDEEGMNGTVEVEKDDQESMAQKDKEKNKSPEDAIYIDNAGLILLHPFLPALFENLKLTKENQWIDEDSQHKGVLVSAFLTTGIDEFEEFNLMLNKILCGVDVEEVVATDMLPDDEVIYECEMLLNEVIMHWSILRNTSIDGLRETFLQRNGTLSKVDIGWLLQVEQKSVDVLLGHLPWGIGVIKLPWMDEMIYVEWA